MSTGVEELADLAEFACGCYVRVTPEWTLSLWQCPIEGCRNWQLIVGELERCVRQLRIQSLGRGILPAGGSR